MENINFFQVDWLKGDPDDVELYRFTIGSTPTFIVECYLQAFHLENFSYLAQGFCTDDKKKSTQFTFNTFEITDAGGAIGFAAEKHESFVSVHLRAITSHEKYTAQIPRNFKGNVAMEDFKRFAAELAEIAADTNLSANLLFKPNT